MRIPTTFKTTLNLRPWTALEARRWLQQKKRRSSRRSIWTRSPTTGCSHLSDFRVRDYGRFSHAQVEGTTHHGDLLNSKSRQDDRAKAAFEARNQVQKDDV